MRRELLIIDESGYSVRLTLWGTPAEDFDGSQNPVLVIKGARLSDYGGRSLSSSLSSIMMIDPPDVPEVHKLKAW